jgi:hypothetical protein
MSDIHDGAFSVFGKPGNTVLSGLIWDDLPRQGGLCRTLGLACKSIAALTCPFIARLLNEDRVFRSNNKLILKTCLGEEHRDAFPSRSGGFYFQWSGFRAAAREVVLPAPATPSSPRDLVLARYDLLNRCALAGAQMRVLSIDLAPGFRTHRRFVPVLSRSHLSDVCSVQSRSSLGW